MTIDFEALKDRIAYNSHDLGEFGRVIRLQYVFNILDDLALLLVTQEEKELVLSNTEADLGLLRGRIMSAVTSSPLDFRSVTALTRDLGVPSSMLLRELTRMEADGLLRRPVSADKKYDEWYRDMTRGLTRQEKWHRRLAWFTSTPIRNEFR